MTLGLNMIVKNESEVLERALNGIASVADEIVIVDTGSTDNTVDIARRYTDKVYSFDWADDFSAARNFAVSKTESDYVMWLDADDIVPKKTAAAVSAFMRGADGTVDVVMLPYIVKRAENGKPTFYYYRERIVKTRLAVWHGVVHEAITPSGNIVRLPSGIVHGKPAGRGSGTRNLDIYSRAIENGKKLDPRDKYYYARELYFNGRYADAKAAFEDYLGGDGFYVNKIDAMLTLAKTYSALGERENAMFAALDSFAFGPPTGEACCFLGGLFFDKADYRTAAFWYEAATKIKPDLNSGAFVDLDSYGFIPLVWLSVCYDRLGNKDKAFRYHTRAKKLRPDHPSIMANTAYFERLGYVDGSTKL